MFLVEGCNIPFLTDPNLPVYPPMEIYSPNNEVEVLTPESLTAYAKEIVAMVRKLGFNVGLFFTKQGFSINTSLEQLKSLYKNLKIVLVVTPGDEDENKVSLCHLSSLRMESKSLEKAMEEVERYFQELSGNYGV